MWKAPDASAGGGNLLNGLWFTTIFSRTPPPKKKKKKDNHPYIALIRKNMFFEVVLKQVVL